MKTLATTENGDIYIKDGQLAVAENLKAVVVVAKQTMLTQKGELVFDTAFGVDFFGELWSSNPNLAAFTASAKRALKTIPQILSVTAFDAQKIGDNVNYQAEITTIYGDFSTNGTL